MTDILADDGSMSVMTPDFRTKFNWVFLIGLLASALLTLFFLFYFNRAFAKVISIAIRLYLRSIGDPHYIDIQSLQISPLGGRIFIGKLSYHGPNETVIVVGAQITWRYWLRRVRQVTLKAPQDGVEGGGEERKEKANGQPCRVLVEIKGLEWFIYNRSPQYDWVWNEMTASKDDDYPPGTSQRREIFRDNKADFKGSPNTGSMTLAPTSSRRSAAVDRTSESFEGIVEKSPYLRMLPIKLDCSRGAVIMGNDHTPCILVAQFDKAQGTVSAKKSRSVDKYKQVFDISFTHPVVQLKTNSNYKESLLSRGKREQTAGATNSRYSPASQRRTRFQKILDLFPMVAISIESFNDTNSQSGDNRPGHGEWIGLSRYLDETEQDGWKFEPEEYATVSNILDCEGANLSFYWDVVGTVPLHGDRPLQGGKLRNGELYSAPEWGVDLSFKGGTIHYGPWADRQRIHLQNMFFPKLYKSAQPAAPLVSGDERVYTEFRVFVELSNSTILRIPIRESSKDWKFRRRLEDGEVRPFGWLEIKVGSESTITYIMAYAASESGWSHTLDLALRKPEVRSSVNHGILCEADVHNLCCDLSGPLVWNSDTHWKFNHIISGMRVYLLREHITLLTDLAGDWASGATPDYWTFVPMIYELNYRLENVEVFFNVNDENIINNPDSAEDNTFIVLRNMKEQGGHLGARVYMDFRQFNPPCSIVKFTMENVNGIDSSNGGCLELGVRTPIWNTWSCSLKNKERLGKVKKFKLDGSYEFYTKTAADLVDTLTLNIGGQGFELTLHGFLIRYFLTIKENYFGENLHFKTLEEWQTQQRAKLSGSSAGSSPPFVKSNDLDVLLMVGAEDLMLILPKHIYDVEQHLKCTMPSLGVDLRFTNYYMDLQVDFAPISVFLWGCSPKLPEVYVDGIIITGHRLFGLPPAEPTYVCNWDLSIGAVLGEFTHPFLQTSLFVLKNFIFGVLDLENALPVPTTAIVHDVTFVRLNIASVKLWLYTSESRVLGLSTQQIKLVLNDLADMIHSERITLTVPGFNICFIDLEDRISCRTKGYLDTNINVVVFGRKKDALGLRRSQQNHIRDSDQRTERTDFLLANDDNESRTNSMNYKPPAMALPNLPPPLHNPTDLVYEQLRNGNPTKSDPSSSNSHSLGRKSSRSFLSSAQTSRLGAINRAVSSHAPSFHSAVESLSEIPEVIQEPRSPCATLSGSKRSTRAPTPTNKGFSHLKLEMTQRPIEVTLSGAFAKPIFPLDQLEPDLTKVPILENLPDNPDNFPSDDVVVSIDNEASRNSIILEFPSGVRGFCTPTAIKEAIDILGHLQPKTPDDVLDYIQTEVVSKLAEVVEKIDQHCKILEACIRIPQFKFCFVDDFSKRSERREYALCLQSRKLRASIRHKHEIQTRDGILIDNEKSRPISSSHVSIGSIKIDLKDHASLQILQESAIATEIGEVLFWASTSKTSTAFLQVKTLTSTVHGKQTAFLCESGTRIAAFGQEISDLFERLGSLQCHRIQNLISALAMASEKPRITNNPASLTRPSYVLRSASSHVRLNDSWKIITRLRYIWETLAGRDPDAKEPILESVKDPIHPPHEAIVTFVDVFRRWREWEMGNIRDSVVAKLIFAGTDSTPSSLAKGHIFNIKVSIETIRLLFDPGPTQNELVVDQLSGTAIIGGPNPIEATMNPTTVGSPVIAAKIVVHIHTRSVRAGVKWEFLDCVETVLGGTIGGNLVKKAAPEPTNHSEGDGDSNGFHLIYTTDHVSLSLDTVHLKVLSMIQNVQASLMFSKSRPDPLKGKFGNVSSLFLRADCGTSEICHGNRILAKGIIRAPNIYGYFDEHWFAETQFHIWKIAVSLEEVSLDIQEQVLGLMEIVDFVVNSEVAHLYRLMNISQKQLGVPRPSVAPNRKVHMVYFLLSLNRFGVSATLLPSLVYQVRGSSVKLSARPNSKDPSEMVIDFDLLHHEHEVRKGVKPADTRSISLLRLPAIYIGIRDRDLDEKRLVDASISVQAVTLDASSIQNLLNALKKPEVLKVIEGARSEWRAIDKKLEEIFGSQIKSIYPENARKPLAYRAQAGVSSLKIETYAPSANLEVDLGFIQVHMSNISANEDQLLSFPEIHLEFGRITVELTRTAENGHWDTCGYLELHTSLHSSTMWTDKGDVCAFYVKSHSLKIDLFAETASTMVNVVGHLQDRLRDLDLSREVKYLKKLRNSKQSIQTLPDAPSSGFNLLNSAVTIEMMGIHVSWIAGSSGVPLEIDYPKQNLDLSFKRIRFSTATKKCNEAQLTIEEFLLQMVDANTERTTARSENSALMPEVVFTVAYSIGEPERRLAFQAKGRPLDLRLTSSCIVAANSIEKSISTATQMFRDASSSWKSTPIESGGERTNMFTTKRMASVLVDADFAGAVVHLSGNTPGGSSMSGNSSAPQGKYGQFTQGDSNGTTKLKSPGLAFKLEYVDSESDGPSLSAEIKISASNNTLYPTVVPLMLEMSNTIKEIMKETPDANPMTDKVEETMEENVSENGSIVSTSPAAVLGRCRLTIGIRICRQEFTLSCQPIARVAASTSYEQIYATINTCEDPEGARFYSVSATVSGLRTSLQHVYSRDSTGNLEVESLTLSLMNSKHVVGSEGLSFMMQFSPIKSIVNVKQFQDFLLFREIWYPEELRNNSPPVLLTEDPSPMFVQRYHKVAATKAFPWNATVAASEIELQIDLGQSLGKSTLKISNIWATSKKTSDWEQTMCLGFESIRISSTGRLSGYIDLQNMQARTSINWDSAIDSLEVIQTPLVEAAIGFKQLQAKISFDFQAFVIADITSFQFLMYNLRGRHLKGKGSDRLVGILDGEKVQIFCTALSAAVGLGLYQAFQRLIQDKITAYELSLKEVEDFLKRPSQIHSHSVSTNRQSLCASSPKNTSSKPSGLLSLHTDVVVNLKEIHVGSFPGSFHDTQVFKLQALNATARFAAEAIGDERIHSMLEMNLGQLRVALSPVKQMSPGISPADVDVVEVIAAAINSKGGIILKVPQFTAFMHTWQSPGCTKVDYIFKSAFEGQVDVGWNFSRVTYIKQMYHNHAKALAKRQGKAPVSSRITMYTDGTPNSPTSSELPNGEESGGDSLNTEERGGDGKGKEREDKSKEASTGEKGKITAVVNVPQSKYEYNAIETPIIETPQLRDMGEATPPLEWIGLHRERLPNLTHQIVIVSLLEIAKEVEDAYSKILGST